MIHNSRGIVTVDFLFAIVICFGLTMILFALSFTLVMVEATQYIAFSVARAQGAGGLSPETQNQAGRAKYAELVSTPPFSKLYSNGWFIVPMSATQVDVRSGVQGNSFYEEYGGGDQAEGTALAFTGVRIPFQASMLKLRFPLLGSTTGNDDDGGFTTYITGFIIREPSVQECQDFMVGRYSAIQGLDSRFNNVRGTGGQTAYAPIEDNGC